MHGQIKTQDCIYDLTHDADVFDAPEGIRVVVIYHDPDLGYDAKAVLYLPRDKAFHLAGKLNNAYLGVHDPAEPEVVRLSDALEQMRRESGAE